MYNKSNAANYSAYILGDYSVFLTNLKGICEKFEENLEYIYKIRKMNLIAI